MPLVGIVAYKNESAATDFISYADVNTVRILQGLTLGNDEDTPVTDEQKSLLAASGDDLFGGETVVTQSQVSARPLVAKARGRRRPRKVIPGRHGRLVLHHGEAQEPGQPPPRS